MSYSRVYLDETAEVATRLNASDIETVARLLAERRRRGGRLFIIGIGGGAAHASHAVADFRSLAGFEAYSPADNVAELTARINDESWELSYVRWLEGCRLTKEDALLVFSVGGGDEQRGISVPLVNSIDYAHTVGSLVCGVVGRDGGHTASNSHACVVVPSPNADNVTAHTEGFQAIIWHCLVTHPALRQNMPKWESMS